jgi:hypothetical protein
MPETNSQEPIAWEYCYCRRCKRIREKSELEFTGQGIRCTRCGGTDLEAPGWVTCPHQKMTAVICPRSGKGIVRDETGLNCTDRCFFRA